MEMLKNAALMPHLQVQLVISVLRQSVSEFNPYLEISLRI